MREAIPANSEATLSGLTGQGADIYVLTEEGGGGGWTRCEQQLQEESGIRGDKAAEQEGEKDPIRSGRGGRRRERK